jgi:hypothetical protein
MPCDALFDHEDLFDPDRQIPDARPGCVEDGVTDGREDADCAELPDPARVLAGTSSLSGSAEPVSSKHYGPGSTRQRPDDSGGSWSNTA